MSDPAIPPAGTEEAAIRDVMGAINAAWLEGRPDEIEPFLAEGFAMALPGFTGTLEGRGPLVESFREFCRSAVLHECRLDPPAVTVAGPVGVATFPFTVVYEREGRKWRSAGRDLRVFGQVDGEWRAAWRAMLDLAEEPAS